MGCHHAGILPAGWRPAAADTNSLGNGIHDELPDSEISQQPGRLQIIICYGELISNHTALRLVTPGKPTLVWDPGGSFMHDNPTYGRKRDVLTQNAPTLEQWWAYRRDGCQEPIMHVYEWAITPRQAQRLYHVLTRFHDPLDPKVRFNPDAPALQCCKKTCEFLQQFADGAPDVPERFFWPHQLGDHLWGQHPGRVLIYRAGRPVEVYIPDDPTGQD
ncbi:MAG: hypothetical protein Kow00105_14540 [Phycisphaeraceae bacterium]